MRFKVFQPWGKLTSVSAVEPPACPYSSKKSTHWKAENGRSQICSREGSSNPQSTAGALNGVPLYAVNPFFNEKSEQSPSRVPRPRLCVGVFSNVKRDSPPTQSRGRGTRNRLSDSDRD